PDAPAEAPRQPPLPQRLSPRHDPRDRIARYHGRVRVRAVALALDDAAALAGGRAGDGPRGARDDQLPARSPAPGDVSRHAEARADRPRVPPTAHAELAAARKAG